MKQHELLQTLRRQALDDVIGVVCCRPATDAESYFRMALDLAAPPAPVRTHIERITSLLRDADAAPSYASWKSAFDLVESWAATGSCAHGLQALLLHLGGHALQQGDAAALGRILAAYADISADERAAWSGFLPALSRALAAPPAVSEARRAACRDALVAVWRAEGLPESWGAHAWEALKMAPALLEHLRDPAALAAAWADHARRAAGQSNARPELLAPVLTLSRALLGALQAGPEYAEVYRVALQAVSSSDRDCDAALCRLLAEANPAPQGLDRLLALRGALAAAGAPWDDAGWRSFACALCREPDASRRAVAARERVTHFLSTLLRDLPSAWPAAVKAAADAFGAGYPADAERARWTAEAASFPALSPEHVQAVGSLAARAAWAAAAPWTALCASLGSRLRAADRAAWCGIALDLLQTASRWDPAALSAATLRWRNFVHVLVLADPSLTESAGKILACQRETLEGPLYEACLALRPGQAAAELDALRACGVGNSAR